MFFDTYSEMLNDTIDGLKREDIQKLFDLIEETRNNGNISLCLAMVEALPPHPIGYVILAKELTEIPNAWKIFPPADNGAIFSALGNDCGYGGNNVC